MPAFPAVLALALTMSLPATTPDTPKGVNAAGTQGCHGLAWTGTIYYSDPQKTHAVGSCSISCREYVNGDAPTFTGGGHCSGVSGPYEFFGDTDCPCRN
jgi:hypothetical protein